MKRSVKILIQSVIVLGIAFLVAYQRGLFEAKTGQEIAGIISDAFFVPGVLFACGGLLSLSATKGTYDMLSFGTGKVMSRFIPTMDRERYKDFYNYKCSKEEGRTWKPDTLLFGCAVLAIALVAFLFYSIL